RRTLQRDSDTMTLRAARESEIDAPSKLRAGLPATLDLVVMKALERNAEKRFATGRELQLALEDWLLSERLPASQAHLSDFMAKVYPNPTAPDFRPELATTAGDGEDATLVRGPSGSTKT